MKNTQINQIEIKIQAIQNMLTNYKQEITKYENIITGLIQKVNELKTIENNIK